MLLFTSDWFNSFLTLGFAVFFLLFYSIYLSAEVNSLRIVFYFRHVAEPIQA